MKIRFKRMLVASTALAAVLAVAGCAPQGGGGSSTPVPTTDSTDQGDTAAVEALVAAAKKEGSVTLYTDQPPATDEATAKAFKEAYGIDVQYVALNSVPIQQRYGTEAQSGVFAADVLVVSGSNAFFADAIAKGWGMKLSEADLPVMKAGNYPAKFKQGDNTATAGLSPFQILYNKANVSGDMIPKDLNALTDPKYKGKILLADPSSADSLLGFYIVIQQKYGNAWFDKVRANGPKFYPTVSGAGQAMVAGEGDLVTPALYAVAAALKTSGAPVEAALPPVTTGPQFNLMLTNSAKAPHPNAAKLFANWVLSKSGSIAAQGGIGYSPYEEDRLPSGFVEMPIPTPAQKAEILKLLGLG